MPPSCAIGSTSSAAWWRAGPDAVEPADLLAQKVREAERIGHPPTTARVLFEAGRRSRRAEREALADDYFRRAYFEAIEGGADRLALEASLSASARSMPLAEARSWARIGFALCDRLEDVDASCAAVHLNLAASLMEAGHLDEAADPARAAVELSRMQPDVRRRVLALNVAGTLAQRTGARQRAVALFEEALTQSEVLEGDRAMLYSNLAVAYGGAGRNADAEELLRSAIAGTGSTPDERWAFMGNLARVVAKDPQRGTEARQILRDIETQLAAAGRQRTMLHAETLRARASVASKLGDLDEAAAALRAADRILEIDLDLDPTSLHRRNVNAALAEVRQERSAAQ